MRDTITKFVRDESGATKIEYSAIGAVLAVGAVVVLETLGVSLQKLFNWAAITVVILLLTGSLAMAAFFYAQTRETRCRWRRLSSKDSPPLKGWICRRCGAESHSMGWGPPKPNECKNAA